MMDVVEASNNYDVHGLALIIVVNLPGLHQVKHLGPRNGDVLSMVGVTLIHSGTAVPGRPELVESGGGDADLYPTRLDSGLLGMHALTGRAEVSGGLLAIEGPDKLTREVFVVDCDPVKRIQLLMGAYEALLV